MCFFSKKFGALCPEQTKYWFDKRQIPGAKLKPYLVLSTGNRCGVYIKQVNSHSRPISVPQVTCSILNPDACSSVSDVKMTPPFCRLQRAKSGWNRSFKESNVFSLQQKPFTWAKNQRNLTESTQRLCFLLKPNPEKRVEKKPC